jgi:hypothetical protein
MEYEYLPHGDRMGSLDPYNLPERSSRTITHGGIRDEIRTVGYLLSRGETWWGVGSSALGTLLILPLAYRLGLSPQNIYQNLGPVLGTTANVVLGATIGLLSDPLGSMLIVTGSSTFDILSDVFRKVASNGEYRVRINEHLKKIGNTLNEYKERIKNGALRSAMGEAFLYPLCGLIPESSPLQLGGFRSSLPNAINGALTDLGQILGVYGGKIGISLGRKAWRGMSALDAGASYFLDHGILAHVEDGIGYLLVPGNPEIEIVRGSQPIGTTVRNAAEITRTSWRTMNSGEPYTPRIQIMPPSRKPRLASGDTGSFSFVPRGNDFPGLYSVSVGQDPLEYIKQPIGENGEILPSSSNGEPWDPTGRIMAITGLTDPEDAARVYEEMKNGVEGELRGSGFTKAAVTAAERLDLL